MAVVAVLWRIWRSRNWVVFEGKQFGIPALMRQFHQQYEEWLALPADGRPMVRSLVVPAEAAVGDSRLICRWDGATKSGSHSAGGMVLLTPDRMLLLAKGVRFPSLDAPAMVELLTLREAITWCLDSGLTEVRFEGDAKVLIDKINQGDAIENWLGAILEEIGLLLCAQPGFSVRFIGRENNRVVHIVARKALSLSPTMYCLFDFRAWMVSRM
ncbi:unnamed protein product [Linum trigynum]|uniref:RNase H type-1 domain-containing protein n=1 Tax=Linum trigynum TaxID=586398 RepID=A0AAV2GV24_9ROSI